MITPSTSALHSARYWGKAFLVALLPEEVKRRDRFQPWASPAMHVLSGAVQLFGCAAAFVVCLIRYVAHFVHGPGWIYLANQPELQYGDFFAMGALGYLSFLFTPQGAFLAYGVAEGIVRTFEAALTARLLGLGASWAVWRAAQQLRRRGGQARLAVLLGPDRPDEVVPPEASRFRMLEIYSVEDKPWSEVQVVEHDGRFFVLTGRRLVPRGGHHAWRYLLHPLEEREVIRGSVVSYPPELAAQVAGDGAPEQA